MTKLKTKIISAVCALCVILCSLSCLSSCKRAERSNDGISIVCTAFPQYDWLKNIIGNADGFSLTLISDNGSDVHSYQPTVADRVEIAECDVLVCVGGESDAWVEEMLTEAEDVRLVRLTEIEGVTLREISDEGIISEHTHEKHGHEHEHGAYDEHMWLSLKNAVACVKYFKELLSELSPESESAISERADTYIAELSALDEEYKKATENAKSNGTPRLIVADRFPFAYITGDYGIEFCAAFEGCSTENNADAGTLKRLAERTAEWNIKNIVITENSDGRLAKSVFAASGTEGGNILVMYSMQSTTRARIASGESYISLMRENLEVLKKAF